jgi:hypothetical protein
MPREMSRHEKADTYFAVVEVLFNDMRTIKYKSVERTVEHLRECMHLLFDGNGEYWSARTDWLKECSYYMKVVTENLNACYAEYEVKNSCDLPFHKYNGFLDLLDECRTWMKDEPEREKRGTALLRGSQSLVCESRVSSRASRSGRVALCGCGSRAHTSAYVSIRQHTSADVALCGWLCVALTARCQQHNHNNYNS